MFLGWYDPDKKRPARLKLADAIERYQDKFGMMPALCLTSVDDAAALTADQRALALEIRGVDYLPRHTFYVGIDDAPAVPLAEAA